MRENSPLLFFSLCSQSVGVEQKDVCIKGGKYSRAECVGSRDAGCLPQYSFIVVNI